MEAIKYQKHSNRLFAKPLFNIRDDSKEKGRVYRNSILSKNDRHRFRPLCRVAMEAIKYQKHSNRLFAKPLFNIRDDSKEKGRVYRNSILSKNDRHRFRPRPWPRVLRTRVVSCAVMHCCSPQGAKQIRSKGLFLFRHPVNMDPLYAPLSVCIKGVWL